MGLIQLSWDALNSIPNLNLEESKMLELGSQQFHEIPHGVGVSYMSYTGDYFRSVCQKFVSIDLNSEGGSVPLDLSFSISPGDDIGLESFNYFDVITDFGTSEHVSNLYSCRKTCHDFCKVGGHMVFINPMTGHWPGHGFHYFTKDHYIKLAELCNYRIILLGSTPTMGNLSTGMQIKCVLQKVEDNKFVSTKVWDELYAETVRGS